MVKSLGLAWPKRIFNGNDGTWKRYLKHQLKPVGGLFFIIVIMMLMNTQFLPNFIDNYCCGGHNSVELMLQKAIGKNHLE